MKVDFIQEYKKHVVIVLGWVLLNKFSNLERFIISVGNMVFILGQKYISIYVKKTVQFIETLYDGDIVVRDIKTAKINFSPL